ncbi:hypothetical protein [Halorussus sp. MSC15.2]|uniref:hypothetical protein n=1 Tax=Halorussus sp. MSC15.2 TaxID=2283638 RepID=UPI0013D4FEB6|nr:hypothetical protein [Halorussus sp. MSC15.2]NEU56748.1 hypothetical protein [Halorussus sp. MSC15.2]
MASSQPNPMDLINRAEGKSLTSVTKQGIGGWLFALSTSAILGVQALTQLLLMPVRLVNKIGTNVVEGLILKPLLVVITGSEASARGVDQMGLFGLPIGTIVLLGTFSIIALYLRQDVTSDTIPGTFTDYFGTGVDEDAEDGA